MGLPESSTSVSSGVAMIEGGGLSHGVCGARSREEGGGDDMEAVMPSFVRHVTRCNDRQRKRRFLHLVSAGRSAMR